MYDFFDALANSIVDRSPGELIGAVIVGLGLSLAIAGLDFLGRRKVRDALMPMIVLMIAANLASMAIAAGYLVHVRRTRGARAREKSQAPPPRIDRMLVESIFRAADKNDDGLLSSDEASLAAAQFVRHADPTGNGSIDAPTLEQAIPSAVYHHGHRSGNPWYKPPSPGSLRVIRPGPRENDSSQPAGPPPAMELGDPAAPADAASPAHDQPKEPPRQNQ